MFTAKINPSWSNYKKAVGNSVKLTASSELFTATDLICEGPIAGLCDREGNLMKYFDLDFSGSDLCLGAGIYYNNVPLIDSKLKKFNFSSANFLLNKADTTTSIPKDFVSTVYRFNTQLYLVNSTQHIWSPDPAANSIIGFTKTGADSFVVDKPLNSINFANEKYQNKTLRELYDIIEAAKALSNPIEHKIQSKYSDILFVELIIDQLFRITDDGTVQSKFVYAIEITETKSDTVYYCVGTVVGISKGGFSITIPIEVDFDVSDKNAEYYVKIIPITIRDPIGSGTSDTNMTTIYLNSITEMIMKRGIFAYPNTVIAKSSANSQSFKSDPSRGFDLKLLKIKIPDNYDPESREYVGAWSGKFSGFLKWTDNPAWIFYDICTNSRYGVGNGQIVEKDINKWDLYRISRYCDELVKNPEIQKYETDLFYTDGQKSNCIYVDKTTELNGLEKAQIKYPPVTTWDSNSNRYVIDSEYTSKNGGEANSIIYLNSLFCDTVDEDTGETIISDSVQKIYKKIIVSVDSGYFGTDSDKNLFVKTNDDSNFTTFRITLIDDFGPTKEFEKNPGYITEFLNTYVDYKHDDNSLSYLLNRSFRNSEKDAKSFLIRKKVLTRSSTVLPVEYTTNNAILRGECSPKTLGYADPFQPRFTANFLINNETECLKILNDLASIFRGIIYYKNDYITATVDVEKPVSYIFNNTNVKDGIFYYASGSVDGNYTVAKVFYRDSYDAFKEKVEAVEDSALIRDYGIVMKEILGFGITNRGQARRIGEWLLATNKYENKSISFTTDIQGLTLKPGDIIQVQDQYKNNSTLQGRVLSVNKDESYIVVDRKLNLDLTDQPISFLFDNFYKKNPGDIESSDEIALLDAKETITLNIDRIENNTNRIYLSELESDVADNFFNRAFSSIVPSTIFSIDVLKFNDIDDLYKIVSIVEDGPNEYSFFCIKHDFSKYFKLDKAKNLDFTDPQSATLSFSSVEALNEINLTSSYYDIELVGVDGIDPNSLDYSFNIPDVSLVNSAAESFSILNLNFDTIFSEIESAASSSDYFSNIYDVLKSGGGIMCKLDSQNQSIKFKTNYADYQSNVKVFIGKFPSNKAGILSTIIDVRMYLYDKDNKFV